jgi:beta-lactamase regulating signal transducer with metallopeptidase domain
MTISTTALMAGLWAAGAITLLLSLAGGVWRLNRIRRTALPWLEERGTLDELAAAAGVNRAVDLLVHEDVDVPITCGFRRSAIILPSDAPTWQRDALRRALVHELEHVRRLDWWTLLTARTLCGVYWFNPLAWLAYRQLSLEAERACDDAVVQREESTLYADQLVSLARRLSARHARPTLAMANRSDLAHRVSAILNRGQARGRAGVLRVSLVGGFAATLALIIAPIHVVGAAAPGTMTADDQRPGTRAVPRINRALLEAAEEGDLDDVRALLEAGAEVNAAVPGDGSPLIVAAREGNEKIVSYLLERGATPDLGVPGDGNPLIMAAREGHLNIVRLLLDQGASVNLVVPGDENALIQASGEGQLEVVKLLVAHGADVNARVWADGSGRREGEWRTPVTMALRGGHQAVVEFLKSVGAT